MELLGSLLGFSVICVTYTHVFSSNLYKSLPRKCAATDSKILCFLLLNKPLGVYILGKHWTKTDSIGWSVIDIFSHTYIIYFISMFYIEILVFQLCISKVKILWIK